VDERSAKSGEMVSGRRR